MGRHHTSRSLGAATFGHTNCVGHDKLPRSTTGLSKWYTGLSLLCKHSSMGPGERAGFELPFLLVGAFRSLIDELHRTLAESGHDQARPLHGFALQAIGPDGSTASELGRRLGVSKQAAAKTVASLERVGYIRREPDSADARAVRLRRTARGQEMLALSAAFFETYHARLAQALGPRRLAELEDVLQGMAAPTRDYLRGFPGWMA